MTAPEPPAKSAAKKAHKEVDCWPESVPRWGKYRDSLLQLHIATLDEEV